ncbi:MAG: L,D-transpeptidase [Solirubrobacterales bacterium]
MSVLALAVVAISAAPAAADVTGPAVIAGPTEPTVSTPERVTAKALPRFSLSIGDAYRFRGRAYVLPRAKVTVRGAVNADLDGQTITVTVTKRGKTVSSDRVRLESRAGKTSFTARVRAGKRGKYLVGVELTPEAAAIADAPPAKSLSVTKSNISRGAKSVSVRVIQSKLAKLKYVVPRGGRFDAATGRALLAFRKANRMKRIEAAGSKVAGKLAANEGSFKLRYKNAGRHIEVSLGRQVMVLADKGRVLRTYHVSTGTASTPTVRGTYRVYRKDYGTNAKRMVHSSYFIRGYAIHGFDPVPIYNASHGCVRVPVPNAASIFKWVRMGTRVDTYR